MHTAAFAACGLDWRYELWDVAPHQLPEAVARVRRPDHAGGNVTIPHKLAVIELLDELDESGRGVGAVNLIRKDEGRLIGSNSDLEGVRAALRAVGFERGKAVILGSGGSARAAQVALAGSEIQLVARRLGNWDEGGRLVRDADLVVNCTPLGRHGETPLGPGELPRQAVIDLVYAPGGTPLVHAAEAAGLRTADGWLVLLAQGAASFTAWTGLPAPLEAMRSALPTS
jgi:shikimate dehydrogenase